jgi:spermidine/putrescine transport system substrate-binding protein
MSNCSEQKENIMRTKMVVLLILVVMLASSFSSASAQTSWACPEGFEGQTLKLFGFPNYVAETTIPDFEEACGVTVEYSVFGTNDQMRTIMEVGDAKYDLVLASSTEFNGLAEQGLIQALDPAKIPNLATIELFIDNSPVDQGFAYSAPYQWGTIGIMYDSTVVETPITSWAEFFAYDGRVTWIDDSRLFLKLALQELGLPFSSIDEAEIQAAADYLLEVPQNEVFAITDSTQVELLLNGEVDAIVVTSRGAVRVMQDCECEDFVYVLPSDGVIPYSDSLSIPTNAENPDLAHAFIDYILDPQVNADISSALGSASPLKGSQELVDEAILNNGVSYMLSADMVAAFINNTLIVDQVGQGTEVYVEAWNRVKSELAGQ